MRVFRSSIVVACVALAVSLIVSFVTSAAIVGRAVRGFGTDRLDAQRTLDVRGSARLRVNADFATWTATVRTEAASLSEAFVSMERSTARVRDVLAEHGFRDEAVAVGSVVTTTHYRRDAQGQSTREVAAHELSRMVTISSGDVARVAMAAADATELLGEGVRLDAPPPEFLVTTLPDLRVKIVGQATEDARRRAEEIAASAGSRLGPLRSADSGPLQVTRPDSTDVSGYGQYDTSTIEKDVSVTVNVAFSIER